MRGFQHISLCHFIPIRTSFIVVALFLALLIACVPTARVADDRGTRSINIADFDAQLAFHREQNGIDRPLSYNVLLKEAAQGHADYILQTGEFGHRGEQGSTVSGRVAASGYRACLAIENIVRGASNIGAVMFTWMNSPGHRRNILNGEVTEYGIARSGAVWVLVMAQPC